MRNPVTEIPSAAAPVILAIAGALLEKMVPFILSVLLTPLQKHHDSLKPPIFLLCACFKSSRVQRNWTWVSLFHRRAGSRMSDIETIEECKVFESMLH